MTITTNFAKSEVEPSPTKKYPPSSTRFDWIMVALSAWIIAGYFLAGWAFIHGRPDYDSPVSWAAAAYTGVLASFVLLFSTQWRNRTKGYAWRRALPQGYGLSLAGVGLALIGAVLNPLWQRLLPPGNGLAAGLVLPHLTVAIGLMLVVAGPFRAARARLDPNQARGWAILGPLVLSMTLVLSVLTNLTLFASPIFEPYYGPYGGKVVKLSGEKFSDLYIMNTEGTGQTRLTASPGLYTWSSDWSPNGKQIVFTRGEPDNPESALYIMNIDGSGLMQLTNMPGAEWVPAWSPDGKRIAFVSKTERDQQIFSINADSSDLRQLTHTVAPTYGPDWSPNGMHIVYNSNASGSDQLYTMNADGNNQTQITSRGTDNWGAAWSPDGRQIMVTANGHPTLANAFQLQDLGIAGVIVQSTLLMGAVLILVTGWALPVGALTVMLTLNSLLMAVFGDRYVLVIPVLAAGILSDFLLWSLKPSIERRGRFYLFASSVPVFLYALYFLALQLTQGIGWSIHLWLGALVLAGLGGWLVSFLFASAQITEGESALSVDI